MTSKTRLIGACAALLGSAALLSGCANSEYLEQRDTITPGAGDAVARNRAIQTINPRPRSAYRTHIHTDGARMHNAMEAYRAAPGGSEQDEPDAPDNRPNNDLSGIPPQ